MSQNGPRIEYNDWTKRFDLYIYSGCQSFKVETGGGNDSWEYMYWWYVMCCRALRRLDVQQISEHTEYGKC